MPSTGLISLFGLTRNVNLQQQIIKDRQERERSSPPPQFPISSGDLEFGIDKGSRYCGQQFSGRKNYSVEVTFKEVDPLRSFISGYFTIHRLTSANSVITTFFEGEIIGVNNVSFLTERWQTDARIDKSHWSKFGAYPSEFFNQEHLRPEHEWLNDQFVFMRWKEQFLVPDHKVLTVPGAIFNGFYYICYDRYAGTISGLYFSKTAEWYQTCEEAHYFNLITHTEMLS